MRDRGSCSSSTAEGPQVLCLPELIVLIQIDRWCGRERGHSSGYSQILYLFDSCQLQVKLEKDPEKFLTTWQP